MLDASLTVLTKSVAIAVLMPFNYGYHIGVLNSPGELIRSCDLADDPEYKLPACFSIDESLWGTLVGLIAVGGAVGGLLGGPLANRLGRIRCLLLANVVLILGSLLLAVSTNEVMFAFGRVRFLFFVF